MKLQYCILESPDSESLEEAVNGNLEKGWELYGDFKMTINSYAQAMIKRHSEEQDMQITCT